MASRLQLPGVRPAGSKTTQPNQPPLRRNGDGATPVHDASRERPRIDVGGHRSESEPRRARDDLFVTADLERSLVLGPSSLMFSEGTPWFGGEQGKLLAIAEGARGGAAANLASEVAVRAMSRHFVSLIPWVAELDGEGDRELEERLARALERSQAALRAEARSYGFDARQVAATMTIACVVWPQLFLVNVGGGRAYLKPPGQPVNRLTDPGAVTRASAPPAAEPAGAVGGRSDRLEFELRCGRLEPGQQLLLASAGLARALTDDEIGAELTAGRSARLACQRLVEAAQPRLQRGERALAVLARFEPAPAG